MFLKIINKYNILVIEDDPYSLINFTKTKYKSLYQLNGGKNIIYLGTFSKYISPAINVGYIISNKFNDKLYSVKECFDLGTSLFIQYVIWDFLKNNNLAQLIQQKIPIYKNLKKQTLQNLIKQYPTQIKNIFYSKGGIFIFVKFKQNPCFVTAAKQNQFFIKSKNQFYSRINICYTNYNP